MMSFNRQQRLKRRHRRENATTHSPFPSPSKMRHKKSPHRAGTGCFSGKRYNGR
jgi:hypothetical protein